MCWSSSVSLATFVLAILGVLYLFYRDAPNDRWMALFGGTVAMIQIAEYFMWLDQSCGTINNMASMFALLVVALEPLMGMIGGLNFSSQPNPNFLRIMLLSYIVFIAYVYFNHVHNQKIKWCGINNCYIDPNDGCNLYWKFTENIPTKIAIIWILFLMLPLLTMTPRYQGIILFLTGLITLVLSRTVHNAAAGSLWCWYAISIIYIKILI